MRWGALSLTRRKQKARRIKDNPPYLLRVLLFLYKLVFRAVEEADDVGPVTDDHQHGNEKGEPLQQWRLMQKKSGRGQGDRRDDRCKRNIAGSIKCNDPDRA